VSNQKRKTTQILALVAGLVMFTGWLAMPSRHNAHATNAVATADNPLIGIWEMTVQGSTTYLYKYAITDGAWVANGNIDQAFLNYRFSPTTGAYVRNADGTYSYRERGWTYTRGGVCNGSFESTGTFTLAASGDQFSGPGVFKLFDLTGNTILTESFTAVATKVGM